MKAFKHPATVIASLALFVSLGGGAALASGLISGSRIINHSIAERKLTNAAITALRGQSSNAYFNHATVPAADLTATVNVPAGNYAIFGEGEFNSPRQDAGTGGCTLKVNGTPLSSASAFGGHSVVIHPGEPSAASNQGVAHLLKKGGTISNECVAFGGDNTVPDDSVLAIRVGSALP